MDKKEKIRQEIERQMKFYDEKEMKAWDALCVTDALWYQGHQKMCAKLLSFLDALPEEPGKSLEEAAEEAATGLNLGSHLRFIEGFKAGAEYQARQLLQGSPMPEDTVLFNKGVEEGRRLEREDMLKDAVEGRVFMSFAPGHNQMVMADVDLPTNTKVRIVVLKEEED